MWPQVPILLYFLGGVLVLCGVVPLLAILGGMNGDDDDDWQDIGLGEDAAAPAPDDLRAADAARSVSRSPAIRPYRTVRRVRVDKEGLVTRIERRKLEWCLCGTPTEDAALDLDALTVAADRLRGQIDILREIRAPDHIIAIAERVAAADRLKQSGQVCSPKDAA